MEPVRVKVYGLFSLTKQSYLRQAAAGVVFAAFIAAGWYFGWPPLSKRLAAARRRRSVISSLPCWAMCRGLCWP